MSPKWNSPPNENAVLTPESLKIDVSPFKNSAEKENVPIFIDLESSSPMNAKDAPKGSTEMMENYDTGNEMVSATSVIMAKALENVSSGPPFTCKICGQMSGKRKIIAHHYIVIHLRVKYQSCGICDEKFYHQYQVTNISPLLG